jgi:K+-sensing histidine kinase KdpD
VVDERLASWRVVAEVRSIAINRSGVTRVLGHHEPGALSGALDAVLDNSLKYSPEHSTVTVEVSLGESTIAVVVTDDGPGVPAEDLPKVVDRFWRSAGTARETGTGLGMSIAKTLLERHGGRLDVATTPDRGLRVSLRVPLEAPLPSDSTGPGTSIGPSTSIGLGTSIDTATPIGPVASGEIGSNNGTMKNETPASTGSDEELSAGQGLARR